MPNTSDRKAVLEILARIQKPMTATDLVWHAEHPPDRYSASTLPIADTQTLLSQLEQEGLVNRAGSVEGQPTWVLNR